MVGLGEVLPPLGMADFHQEGTGVLRLWDRDFTGPGAGVLPVRVLCSEQGLTVPIALAATAGARPQVVAGDFPVPDDVLVTLEAPYGGPAAAVAAGLAALPDHAKWTTLLASDLPGAEAAVRTLLAAEPGDDDDGVCLLAPDGRLQWLLGCYRTSALLDRISERGDPPLTAMHRLLSPLRLLPDPAPDDEVGDVDTPDDLRRYTGS